MESNYNRIHSSIEKLESPYQVSTTFNWIKNFANRFKDEMGVQEKEQILLTKLRNKEL